MISTVGRSCAGDSGAPILNISATQAVLVGVLTGSQRGTNDQCGQKRSDGNYYQLFTLVGRYANLAFLAATEAARAQEDLISNQSERIAELEYQLAEAQTVNSELKKQIPQTIVCSKGKVIKKVVSLSPVCPTGYRKSGK